MILGVAPQFDEVTKYSLSWYNRLSEKLDAPKVELKGAEATRAAYNRAVSQHNPELFIFFDHGNRGCLVDCEGGHLLDSGNLDTVKGREVYTMCCLAAADLGKSAYRKGCRAWWGYTKPFSFVTTDEGVFGRLANMGLLLRMNHGVSWMEAVKRVKEAYDEEIDRLEDSGNPWTLVSLVNDRNCLVCWCDGNPPPTSCPVRMLGVALLGKAGQRMTRAAAVSMAAFLVSYVLALNGYVESWGRGWGYAGFAGMFVFFVVGVREYLKWLSSN